MKVIRRRSWLLRKLSLFLMVFCILISSIGSMPAKAITQSELNKYSQNNIFFYDPNASSSSGGRVGSGCKYSSIEGSNLQEKVLSFLLSIGLNDIGASGVFGNMMSEGLGSGNLLAHEDGVDSTSDIGTWYTAATRYGPNGLLVKYEDVHGLDDPNIMHGLGFIQWSFGRRVNLLKALEEAGGLDKYAREWDDSTGTYVYDNVPYDLLKGMIGEETADAILSAELNFFFTEHQAYKVTQDD
ncbi:hypothetical protein IJ135_00695 [Candidatus Saccharibacteria bacterium]|nr:hypothetical protein [Candidatus Saccharibacteria bacterium]